ncbi:MAG: hypothetical protein RIN55_07990 [Tissierellaceae bacterium]|nr:hypothetical protein [Tissierellaceae bacterium]
MLGFVLGFLSARVIDKMIPNSGNKSLFSGIFKDFFLIAIFIISYLVQIIIHEAGHLIFGLATGYTFVSFRVGSLTIIKEDGKYKFKKYNIPGTAGQCLMMPPELENDKYPFVIYNFGGVFMNLIASGISIISLILIKDIKFPLNTILLLFGLAGIVAALTNGIPFKISGLPNDAYNVKSMLKDDEAKTGFYLQLRVNGLLSKGIRIKDMDYNLFELKEGADVSNPLNTGIKLLEYTWYLDNMDFENATRVMDSLVPHINELVPLYTYEINSERIFLELIGECNKNLIDRLYNKNLKKYIKASKFMMSKIRLQMAYEAFYNEDKTKALEYYEKLKDLYDNFPIKGEAEMELMLGDWMKERIDES